MAVRRKSMMELVDTDESYDTPPLAIGNDTIGAPADGPTVEPVAALDQAIEAIDALEDGRLADAIAISDDKPGTQLEMAITDRKHLDWNEGAKLFARHSRLSNEESRLKAEAKFVKAELEVAALDLANWGRRLRQQHPVSVEEDPVFGVPQPPAEPTAASGVEEPEPQDTTLVDASSSPEANEEPSADEAPGYVDPETDDVLS